MEREVWKRFSEAAVDSSVRTADLLEDIVGSERKSGFGTWLFARRVSF